MFLETPSLVYVNVCWCFGASIFAGNMTAVKKVNTIDTSTLKPAAYRLSSCEDHVDVWLLITAVNKNHIAHAWWLRESSSRDGYRPVLSITGAATDASLASTTRVNTARVRDVQRYGRPAGSGQKF